MKKIFFTLVVTLIFGTSIYTVISYNKNKTTVSAISNNDNNRSNENSSANNDVNKSVILNKEKAPSFILKDINGKEVSLSDLKGKRVMLNFWATWCPPCRAEMPDIEKFYQENKESGLVILAVNLGEDDQTVKSFIKKNKYNFNVLFDTDQDVAIDYNIVSIPTTYFIDKEGNIVSKKVGAMTIEEMRANVNLLNK